MWERLREFQVLVARRRASSRRRATGAASSRSDEVVIAAIALIIALPSHAPGGARAPRARLPLGKPHRLRRDFAGGPWTIGDRCENGLTAAPEVSLLWAVCAETVPALGTIYGVGEGLTQDRQIKKKCRESYSQ